MRKVTIITDSIACLTKEITEKYGIDVIPINVRIGGTWYRDGIDISPSRAYELFKEDPESFQTSAATPKDFLEAYQSASKKADNILCIMVSSKISATCETARQMGEIAAAELPHTRIEVLDSRTATAAEGFIALAAAREAADGKDFDEVMNTACRVRDKVSCAVLLDTIQHVYRSGRIPKIASKVGSFLNIRPIFTLSETVHFSGAVRNQHSGINRIIQLMRNDVGENPAHIAVMHAYAPEEAKKLASRVASEFNCAELWLTEFSPIMGYACGTGTLALAYYTDVD